ncbi:MAG: hypothetical protein IID61_13065 [SAR324 cluster bacterium]|nr:hypothetical protein [SAR324 cluster bacterium]
MNKAIPFLALAALPASANMIFASAHGRTMVIGAGMGVHWSASADAFMKSARILHGSA